MSNSGVHTDSFLIVDVQDAVTKAILIEKRGEHYVVSGVGEAATTIDDPNLDVTIGINNAIITIETVTTSQLLLRGALVKPRRENTLGVDAFLCSSSAEGLHMAVAGVIGMMSAESARRASLGAGAFLIDVFAIDDGRMRYQRIEQMRGLKPDLFLLAGGTDGGGTKQVLEMAEIIRTAGLKPRFGAPYKLPIIFAGNRVIRKRVAETLNDKFAVKIVENVRPVLEKENLGPAKAGIYDAFMEHVIVHSPGYHKLMNWTDEPIAPTQAVIGEILYAYAQARSANLIGLDIGGASLDTYSVFDGVFNRTLNADFGMSYGICNIMKVTGVKNILRWIPIEMEEAEVRNIIGNMMLQGSTTHPSKQLLVQHAVAREALKLGLKHHKTLARRLKGVKVERTFADLFDQALPETYIDMMNVNLVIGTGHALSNAKIEQSALILLDALQPEGITEMMIDKTRILSHLGMLSKVNRNAALAILTRDCLLNLGTCIAPKGIVKTGDVVLEIRMKTIDGPVVETTITCGELKALPLKMGSFAEIELAPRRNVDVGKGRGKRLQTRVIGGAMGLLIDARGRPLRMQDTKQQIDAWMKALDAYPNITNNRSSGVK